MKELEQILKAHGAAYPGMQPSDAVKLIYQNEFGCGHLIRDPEQALRYLREEYDCVTFDGSMECWEDIGNGFVRVNLAAVPAEGLDRIGRAFLDTAEAHRGDAARFRQKLDVLRRVTEAGSFGFDIQALETYLAAYEEAGYPATSHSETYRASYRPAYRVILKRILVD